MSRLSHERNLVPLPRYDAERIALLAIAADAQCMYVPPAAVVGRAMGFTLEGVRLGRDASGTGVATQSNGYVTLRLGALCQQE
jgi:hypothetical protein